MGARCITVCSTTRRLKETKTPVSSREEDKGRKVRYDSNGKPIS